MARSSRCWTAWVIPSCRCQPRTAIPFQQTCRRAPIPSGEARPLRAVLPDLDRRRALRSQSNCELAVGHRAGGRTRRRLNPKPRPTRGRSRGRPCARSPMRLRSRGLQDAIATTPGWATKTTPLTVRGVDDGILYVMDGVPVRAARWSFGLALDPGMIESSMSSPVHSAGVRLQVGGVIEVRSGAHPADAWLGSLDVAGGSHATREFSTITGGPLGQKVAATVGVSGQGSSRFLDPVHPDNLHNDGHAFSGGGEIAWSGSPNNIVTGVVGFGRSHFYVPHSEEQEEAGQDQRQRLRQSWQTVSWQRSWSSAVVSQVAAYHRLGSSALVGSENDVPLFTDADRSLRRLGVLASLTHQRGRHLIKLGAEASRLSLREDFTFAVTNDEEAEDAGLSNAARAFTPDHPFVFATPPGFLYRSTFRIPSRIGKPRSTWRSADRSRLWRRTHVEPRRPSIRPFPERLCARRSHGSSSRPTRKSSWLRRNRRSSLQFSDETGGG